MCETHILNLHNTDLHNNTSTRFRHSSDRFHPMTLYRYTLSGVEQNHNMYAYPIYCMHLMAHMFYLS